MSWIADKWGRRRSLIGTMTAASISIIAAGFSSNITTLIISFFFAGFSLCGYESIVLVYNSEISGMQNKKIFLKIMIY
jgi:MFS family permease